MSVTIKWEGDKELQRALQKAYAKSPEVTQAVIKNNGEKLRARAMALSPVDTWFMHDNIDSYYQGGGSFFDAYVHSRAGYSGFVEFGTRKMSAQPFMRPAVEWIGPQLNDELKDVYRGLFV